MSKRLIPAERREIIRKYLAQKQFVSLAELASELDVSESTIRRDLDKLEKEKFLERTHGGAIISKKMSEEPVFIQSERSHAEEKNWIGLAAAQLIDSGDSIFLSSGTTTAQVARYINARDDLKNVTIITNNVSAALEIQRAEIKVVLVGGVLRRAASAVGGSFAVNMINQIYSDKAVIGADGLSFKYGCTFSVETEAEISKIMIERTHGKVILAADHSKWGVVSTYRVAKLSDFDVYVTDPGVPDSDLITLDDQNLEIIICDETGILTRKLS